MTDEKTLAMKLIPIVQMDCPTCILILEKEIKKLHGVKEARGNYITKMVKVTYDSDAVGLSEIEAAIEHVGYQIAYKKYPNVASKLKGLFRKEKPEKVKTISDNDFPSRVLHNSKPVAVLFSSPTCPACSVAKEIFTQAAEELLGQAELYEMDVTTSKTWQNYNITATPTFLIFIDGQLKETIVAVPKKNEIINALSKETDAPKNNITQDSS